MSTKLAEAAEIRLEKPSYLELVFALVIVWGFGDAVSTLLAWSFTGRLDLEANPWVRLLLAHEPMLLLVVKAAVVLYVGVVLIECRDLVQRVPWWRSWLLSVVGLGAVIVLTNVYVGLSALA